MQFCDSESDACFHYGPLAQAFQSDILQHVPYYTIILCLDGTCCLDCDTRQVDLKAYSALTISPGSMLNVRKVDSNALLCIEFNRAFYCVEYHDVEISCNGLLFNGAMQTPVIRIPDPEHAPLTLLLEMIRMEFRHTDSLQLEMLRALLKRLIITCARIAKEHIKETRSLRFEDTDLISSFSALVDKHFRSKHKVAEYAAMLNRSPKTLSNLFTRYSNHSALKIIHDRITLEARRMLLMTNRTAKEIAFELGFRDPAQFNRFFKKMTGQTTQQCREHQPLAISADRALNTAPPRE